MDSSTVLSILAILTPILTLVSAWLFITVIELKVKTALLESKVDGHKEQLGEINKRVLAIIKAFQIPYEEDDK
jgi:hypothetical protein